MHVEVLSEKQRELLPLIEKFSKDYFLVGGTAVALHEKLFREQLSYFDDIDYSEKIDYLEDETDEKTIKEFLVDIATARF